MSKSSLNIIGIFDDQDKLISSIKSIQSKGIRIKDVISPYPIHEVFSLLKLKTRMPVAAILYGVFAVTAIFLFLYWTSVINYPLRFGGKPQNTLSFIVIMFVGTINITALLSIVTFFLREKKGPGAKTETIIPDLTDDKYAILIDDAENLGNEKRKEINTVFKETGAIEVLEQELNNAI